MMDADVRAQLAEIVVQLQRLAYAVERRAKDVRDNNVCCRRCLSTLVPVLCKTCPACGAMMSRDVNDTGGSTS